MKSDLEKLSDALDADPSLTEKEKREIYQEALEEEKYKSQEYDDGMREAQNELDEMDGLNDNYIDDFDDY